MPAIPLPRKIPVDRLDKHVGRPRPVVSPVPRVVVQCRFGRPNLFQRHPLADHVGDPIPNDDYRVAVFDDVGLVAHAAVTGNRIRSAFLQPCRDGDIQHVVQSLDESIDAAAIIGVDDRIGGGHEQVAGDQDIGTPEVDDHVPVGVSPGVVIQEDRFSVEIEVPPIFKECVQRPFGDGPVFFNHARGHFLMRNDARRIAVQRHAGLRHRFVAAGMVLVTMGVDHPANRAAGKLANCGQHLVARFPPTGIHHQHPVVSDLDGNIRGRSRQHVDVALDMEGFDVLSVQSRSRRHYAGKQREQDNQSARPVGRPRQDFVRPRGLPPRTANHWRRPLRPSLRFRACTPGMSIRRRRKSHRTASRTCRPILRGMDSRRAGSGGPGAGVAALP